MMKWIEHTAGKVIIGGLIFSFGLSLLKSCADRAQAPAAPQPKAGAAAPATAITTHVGATSTARPSVASTTSAPLVVVFPALTPPAGLTSGRVEYSIAGAPRIDYGEYGEFVKIGSAGVPSSTSSFASLPVSSLAADLPPRGLARESWTLWTRVHMPGEQMFAIRLQAPDRALAELHVDGQGAAVVSMDNAGAAGQQTALGQINLGAGWHTLTLSVTHSASEQRAGAVGAAVFMRGPNEASPTNFTPFSPAASVLRAIPVSGEGQPAPATTEKKS